MPHSKKGDFIRNMLKTSNETNNRNSKESKNNKENKESGETKIKDRDQTSNHDNATSSNHFAEGNTLVSSTYVPQSNAQLIRLLFPYYKKNMGIFLTDFVCAALTTVCDLVLPLILAHILDTARRNPENFVLSFVSQMTFYYVMLRIIEVIARYYMQSKGHIMGARIEKEMRANVYQHLQTLPQEFFVKHKTGQIMATLTTDLFDITEFSHHCPEEYFIGAIKLVVSFIILIQIDWLLTLVVFAMIPLLFYFASQSRRKIRHSKMQERRQIGEINSGIEDSFQGIHVVKSFANEDVEAGKFAKYNHTLYNIKEMFYYALASYATVTRIFDGIMLATILLLGGWSLAQGRISIGEFVAYFLYVQSLLAAVQRIVEFQEQFERGMTGLERFSMVMNTKSNIVEKPDAVVLEEAKGHIECRHVAFHYPGHEEMVLEDLNLEVKPGTKLAIVGPSGAGKTTLVNLLARFYDVTEGAILVDGHDIRDLTIQSLRNQIGMVQQDVYLFNATVRDNIAYGKPDATEQEILAAAKMAGAYDFIMNLPEGFDAMVGERGVLLSGGQKQRLSIARVFLKNPPILILDEATSSLDNESERLIQSSLKKLAEGRTSITIAHRLSTIKDADQILVLTERGIEEQGTHASLMAQEGIYFNLYQSIENFYPDATA